MQMWQLRHREGKEPAQGHTAGTQGVWLQVYLQHYTGLSLGGGGDPLRAERGTLGVLFGDLAPAELT